MATNFLKSLSAIGLCFVSIVSYASPAERPRDLEAVYNSEEGSITITGRAPSYTEFDWEWYTQDPLTEISRVTVERHIVSTDWPTEFYGEILDVTPGDAFSFVDTEVEAGVKYEYRLAAWVGNERGTYNSVLLYTGVLPAIISDLTLSTPDTSTAAVIISITAPTKSSTGGDLTDEMTIDIEREEFWTYENVKTISGVKPGETVSWTDDQVSLGSTQCYRAYARYGEDGKGEGLGASIYVGLDRPSAPTDLKVDVSDNDVVLTWNAPQTGYNGGSIIPDELTYNIYRKYPDDYDYTLIKGGLTGTTFTDEVDFDEETAVKYSIAAVNATGEGYKTLESDIVTVGPAAGLPFTESFADGTLDHKSWTTETSQDSEYYVYKAWDFVTRGSFYFLAIDDYIDIEPQDGDSGMGYCKFYGYSPEGQTESLVSPRINIAAAECPEVSFYYYNIPMSSWCNAIAVAVSYDGADYEDLVRIDPTDDFTTPYWQEVKLPLTAAKGHKTVNIKLSAVHLIEGYPQDVYIDNLRVVDLGTSGIDAAVATDGQVDVTASAGTISVTAPQGTPVTVVTISGSVVATGSGSHEVTLAPGIYIVRVGNHVSKVCVK